MFPTLLMVILLACSERKTPDSNSDTAEADPDAETDELEVNTIDPNRQGHSICSAGGTVQGSSISGSICFAPVDLNAGTPSTSASFQWQPGPIAPVSP